MKFVIFGTMRSVRNTRCQYYKDVHKERCDCIWLSHFYAYTAFSRKVVGKSARANPERYYG